uniref:Glycosyltransferase n=1 Tax=Aegilops tauschii subsp. strangulata TaxID=200361 RepID=A0A453M702_AEGTS
AMDAGSSSSPLHIVVVPWLAFGHLLPYLELSERLAERGHRVSYVSTPRNLARLPTLRPAAAPRMDLVALPLPRVDGLPDGAESTNDVPDDKRELHFKAFDGLAAPFAEFMAAACADEATRPHWVIADCFHHWVAAAAFEHKVPCVILLPTAALIATAHRDQPTEARRAQSQPAVGQSTRSSPLRTRGEATDLLQPWRVWYVHHAALIVDKGEVHGRGHPELRRVGARVFPAGGDNSRQAGRSPRPSAAVSRCSPLCRRQRGRACHRAVAGRATSRLGAVRGAGERGAAARGAGA